MGNYVLLLFSLIKLKSNNLTWTKIVTHWQLMSREEEETGAVVNSLNQDLSYWGTIIRLFYELNRLRKSSIKREITHLLCLCVYTTRLSLRGGCYKNEKQWLRKKIAVNFLQLLTNRGRPHLLTEVSRSKNKAPTTTSGKLSTRKLQWNVAGLWLLFVSWVCWLVRLLAQSCEVEHGIIST